MIWSHPLHSNFKWVFSSLPSIHGKRRDLLENRPVSIIVHLPYHHVYHISCFLTWSFIRIELPLRTWRLAIKCSLPMSLCYCAAELLCFFAHLKLMDKFHIEATKNTKKTLKKSRNAEGYAWKIGKFWIKNNLSELLNSVRLKHYWFFSVEYVGNGKLCELTKHLIEDTILLEPLNSDFFSITSNSKTIL